MADERRRWTQPRTVAVALFAIASGLVLAYPLAGAGYDILGRELRRQYDIQIVMNPDSTEFVYALKYEFSPGWFDLRPAAARVEIWTYDLSRRKGPRRIAGWPHDPNAYPRLLQWTVEGIYLAFGWRKPEGGERVTCDLVDPRSGIRTPIGEPPWEQLRNERPPAPVYYREEYRQVPHVEEHGHEFFVWDPATYKLNPLFALPPDPHGYDLGRALERSRAHGLRQDGFQRIERLDAIEEADGLLLQIHTYARRTAPFARRYRLDIELTAPMAGDEPYVTVETSRTVWDTLVTPHPARDTLVIRVPNERILEVFRPDRARIRRYEYPHTSHVTAILVPDSLAGDESVGRGIMNGNALRGATRGAGVRIPLP